MGYIGVLKEKDRQSSVLLRTLLIVCFAEIEIEKIRFGVLYRSLEI